MKKIILIVFILLTISGCNTQKTQNISFEDVYLYFQNDLSKYKYLIPQNIQTWELNWEIYLDIFGNNEDFLLQTQIQSIFSKINSDIETSSTINTKFRDKQTKINTDYSWVVLNKIFTWEHFFKIESFDVNLWSWNYQTNLVYILLNNIKNKRIQTQTTHTKIFTTHEDLYFVFDNLISWDVFYPISQKTTNKSTTYDLILSPDFIIKTKNNTDIDIQNFDWKLIYYNKNHIELTIKELILWPNKDIISWYIWSKSWEIKIKNNQNYTKTFSRKINKKNIDLSYSYKHDFQEIYNINWQFYWDLNDKIYINSVLSISPLYVYWTNLEKNIEIDINGYYKNNENIILNSQKPQNYVILEQILWDKYFLQKILTEK